MAWVGAKVCELCIGDLLYCDRHDAYFCPVCDRVGYLKIAGLLQAAKPLYGRRA